MKTIEIVVTVLDEATEQDYENILSDTKSDNLVYSAHIVKD